MSADLSGLRDIHLPAPISWWPLAPGWWLLLGVLLTLLAFTLWIALHRRRNRWRRAATVELKRLRQAWQRGEVEPGQLVQQLSILLRRVALTRFPRHQVAALHGEEWLAFLDHPLARPEFSSGVGRVLAAGPYTPVAATDDPEALFTLARRWLRALPQERRR